VLITGASSGIGLVAAGTFAAEGARLALLGRDADTLASALREAGIEAVVVVADLADNDAVARAVRTAVDELGGLDVLVSNAAAGVFGHFLDVEPEDFDRAVDVTLRGAINVTRAALPHLRTSRGVIVATGSLVSRLPMSSWGSYTAAKHGLRGFFNSLRIEEREQRSGVRIALVHPGIVDTPFWTRATSATGLRPLVPPDAYDARVVARALVQSAIRPRNEVMLGGVTLLGDLGFAFVRPLAESVLIAMDRWMRSGHERAAGPGALWRATPSPQLGAGLRPRDSLLARLQLRPRIRPAGGLPPQRLPRLAAVAAEAIRLRRRLRAPVPERSERPRH
jgi:NAD(P)-dependent dehydrogenase (short-subunit alcohol dehydrogenase family)